MNRRQAIFQIPNPPVDADAEVLISKGRAKRLRVLAVEAAVTVGIAIDQVVLTFESKSLQWLICGGPHITGGVQVDVGWFIGGAGGNSTQSAPMTVSQEREIHPLPSEIWFEEDLTLVVALLQGTGQLGAVAAVVEFEE